MKTAALLTFALGGATVFSVARRPAANPGTATEDYGRRLVAQTAELLGPHAADPKLR